MEHVTFDEFFDFVKNEDANWYIPGLKEYFEGLNQDEIYIQDNFLGKLVYQFNKFENNLKEAVFDKFICYRKMTDEKESRKNFYSIYYDSNYRTRNRYGCKCSRNRFNPRQHCSC